MVFSHEFIITVLFGLLDIVFLGLVKVLWEDKKTIEKRIDNVEIAMEEERKNFEKEMKALREDMQSFKTNYLSRFESVHKRLSEVEVNVVREIGELKVLIVRNTESL